VHKAERKKYIFVYILLYCFTYYFLPLLSEAYRIKLIRADDDRIFILQHPFSSFQLFTFSSDVIFALFNYVCSVYINLLHPAYYSDIPEYIWCGRI